jgi:hypothetical protein
MDMMKRGTLNFVIDLISFINLVCPAVTGYIIRYIPPPGSEDEDAVSGAKSSLNR